MSELYASQLKNKSNFQFYARGSAAALFPMLIISVSSMTLQGRLSPLTPWSKFPPPLPLLPPLPPPLPSPPLPFLSFPLPLEVGPLIAARGSGGAL